MKLSDKFVTTDWLNQHLHEKNFLLVEASVHYDPSLYQNGIDHLENAYSDYLQSHIPSALFADLFDLNEEGAAVPFTFSHPQAFADKVSQLGLVQEGKPIIIYDRGAIVGDDLPASFWSSRLAWQLQAIGIKEVKILDGGFYKWKKEGRPLAQGPEKTPKPSSFQVHFQDIRADSDDLQVAMKDPETLIIDCLSRDQYTGLDHPYGKDKAGHIPHSKNVFFADLGDFETGALLDEESLKNKFQSIGALDPDRKVITYCGFGIAATWVQYILNGLGQNQVKVYDGSLNDWHLKGLPVVSDELLN